MGPIQFERFKVWEENVNQEDYFSNIVDEQTLFEVFPHMVDYEMLDAVDRRIPAYAKNNIIDKDGNLMRFFERKAKVHNTNKHQVHWRLETGEGDLRSTFMENLNGEKTQLGDRGSLFKIKTDVNWYGPNTLLLVEGMREVPLMVTSEPSQHGHGWEYYAKLVVDEDSVFITPEDIKPGTRMMPAGAPMGEAQVKRAPLAIGAGNSYVEFSVPLNRFGWEIEITDDAHMASKNFRIPEKFRNELAVQSGKEYAQGPDILYNSLEMKFNATVNYQKDLWLTYGRMAGRYGGKFLDGVTANPVQTGPGIFEFLEASYTLDYAVNGGSIELLSDWLQAAWTDKVPYNQRNIRIAGGTGFLRVWKRWCELADQYGIIQTPEYNYSNEEGLYPGRKGVGVGMKQYRSIFLEPFGKVTVDYLPLLDSKKVEPRTHRGLSIQSYQAIVTDYGYGEGDESNVYLVKNPQREQYGYVIGTWSPLGKVLGRPEVSNRFPGGKGKKNAFDYVSECEFGLLVKDPSYMLWLRPSFV